MTLSWSHILVLSTLTAMVGCTESDPPRIATPIVPAIVESKGPESQRVSVESTGEAETPDGFDRRDDKPADTLQAFRLPDQRPVHDAQRAEEVGIQLFESRRLKLYTDIDAEAARSLPPLMDALFEEWQNYFGPLPPARDGSDFQLTGYLMQDQEPFRDAGMLPANVPVFAHGKHQQLEFWMNDQEHPYYRRHLMLHEATHCFMQAMGGTTIDVPLWYLEGMAELFATHRINPEGKPEFRVVPADPAKFVGFGRIEMIARDVKSGEAFTLPQLVSLTPQHLQQRQSAYAWSWVTCLMADRSPTYHAAFQQLARRAPVEGFANVRSEVLDPLTSDFAVEWTLLTRSFDYGHDFAANSIAFAEGELLADFADRQVSIRANRGWQSSGVSVKTEHDYGVAATGRITLAEEPQPWTSEPQGITIRYANAEPIGQLQGIIIGDSTGELEQQRTISEVFSIGRGVTLVAPQEGTLYLRINDFNSQRADNTGHYDVELNKTDSALQSPAND